MIVTPVLIVLAVLAYLGKSLVMLTSVGGIAVALWLARRQPIGGRIASSSAGAVLFSVLAEVVHLLHHLVTGPVDHGGFWVSAVLVGLINAAAMAPLLGLDEWLRRRRAARLV